MEKLCLLFSNKLTMTDLSQIEVHLKVLKLSTTRIPSLKEFKRAYRNLLKLHPDHGGDTQIFQEITLAAREVFEFLRTHPKEGSKSESDNDSELLRAFEGSNTVNYNKGNIVFEINSTETDKWVECLTIRLGKPINHENDSLRYKIEELRIPNIPAATKTNFGSITVTVWPNPKTTVPKVMVQGKCYLAFVTFIVPLILRDIKAAGKLPLTTANSSSKVLPLELAIDSDDEPEVDEKEITFSKALGRLESEVLNMRNDMTSKLDVALKTESSNNSSKLHTRLDSLEKLLSDNAKQNSLLTTSIDKLRETIEMTSKPENISLNDTQLQKLTTDLINSKNSELNALEASVSALKNDMISTSDLARIDTKVDDMKTAVEGVQSSNLKLSETLDIINDKIDKVNKSANVEMTQLRQNSDKSLQMFESMVKTLKNIEAGAALGTSPSPQQAEGQRIETSDPIETPQKKAFYLLPL